jgi:hypothetical protein
MSAAGDGLGEPDICAIGAADGLGEADICATAAAGDGLGEPDICATGAADGDPDGEAWATAAAGDGLGEPDICATGAADGDADGEACATGCAVATSVAAPATSAPSDIMPTNQRFILEASSSGCSKMARTARTQCLEALTRGERSLAN